MTLPCINRRILLLGRFGVALVTDTGLRGWSINLYFKTRPGPFGWGGGYIGGATAYLVRWGVAQGAMYTPKPWRIGFTRSGNSPWIQH
jgi:hypothetical protein